MATGYGINRVPASAGGAALMAAAVNGGQKKTYIEVFDLSLASVAKAINDDNLCFNIPADEVPLMLEVRSTVSLGTSQLRFGTKAVPDQLGAAKAYGTTPDAAVEFLRASMKGRPLTARTRIFMSILTAALPAAGTIVVELETSARG